MQLVGFELGEVIHTAGETVVVRAMAAGGFQVVLKYLDSEHPSPELLARWRHEYEVLRSIDSAHVIKARSLESTVRSAVLVLEDFAACSLAQLIERHPLDLADRLVLAIGLARALSDVHRHQVIHGDLAPKNVLVDPATLALKLCDFGLATRLSIQPRRADATAMVGTLDYMSPEQTGRTNLDVDYRSDLYSLGATLYELFAGRKPFVSSDPMALLHAQLATLPTPLHDLDSSIPEPVAGIVQKLLAKHPDDRYQSSYGLIHDLEICAANWRLHRRVDRFRLAAADVPERFYVSQKLYGRQHECARLLAAFKRVASQGAVELVLISGYSGIGKTALIHELYRPVLARRGYLLRGKCDQYSRHQPYVALTQAFGQLLQTLASEGAERRHYWRSRLVETLGANLGVIAEIIPTLALLTGTPAPPPPLPPAESEQRFHIAVAQLLAALATPGHPLLLFLDDLQWADVSTLRLLEALSSTQEERWVLIVCAYRDHEVQVGDALWQSLQTLARGTTHVEHLQLAPIPEAEVVQLVADTLHAAPSDVTELAALCFAKTRGNPFFLSQFLKSLHEQGELSYERGQGRWVWDLARIRSRQMTDNVVTLLLAKLSLLPPATQSLLARAAHLGGRFDQRELMAIGERDARETADVLWPALQSGLLVPLNDDYKYIASPERLRGAHYRFLHDRVQQAAHELVSEAERPALRWRLGQLLLAASNEAELEERLFVILESLNAGSAALDDPRERESLCALNLRGGLRAKAASAYDTAITLLSEAERLLPADPWRVDPERSLLLYRNLAEAEYLSGRFDAAEQRLGALIASAPSVAAKVSLCLAQAEQMNLRGHFEGAFEVLCQALTLLGRSFPQSEAAAGACFVSEFAEIDARLGTQTEHALLHQAEMRVAEPLLEMQIHFGLAYATYQTSRGVSYVLNACRMVRLTLDHGLCDLSCIGYVTLCTAMAAMGKPYPQVYAMGRMARRLSELRDNAYFRLSVYQYFAAFYQHWGDPLRDTLPYLEQGLTLGRAGINPLAAGYCALLKPVNAFVAGLPLEDIELDAEQGLAFLKRSGQPNTIAMLHCGVLQPIAALRGRTLRATSFDSAELPIAQCLAGDFDTPSVPLAFYCFAMTRHAYLFDAATEWRQASAQAAMIGAMLPDGPTLVETLYFRALGLLKAEFNGDEDAAAARKEARELHARFLGWAEHNPANFLHKALLIGAELARAEDDTRAAMELYARAIDAAGEAGALHSEALANELYARFWQAQGQQQLASNFIREAYFHYQRWGATAKCRQLEARWPQILFRAVELRRALSASPSSSLGVSSSLGMLDLHSLLKASRLLSQEVHVDALLQKLLGVVLENAGAHSGAIVLCEDASWSVEAIGRYDEGRVLSFDRLALEPGAAAAQLPAELIEHVRLTRELLVLNQPAADPRYAQSRYFLTRQPRAVLVLPVLSQGRLVAVIYLENELLEGAFAERQVRTLELLGAQAAVSLVNARHVETLERKVAERTEELRQMSMKDGLTGIANRRNFDERLVGEWRRARRTGKPISLLMIDIDHFKPYNDHHGHVEGDRCIRSVAQALAQVMHRSTDLVARYGGEEFAAILPDTDQETAHWLAESCLQALAELALPHRASATSPWVSVSIGLCSMTVDSDLPAETLVTRADKALYEAKRAGRGQVRAWRP